MTFPASVSSDLIESLVEHLNSVNTLDWYYISNAPEAVQPNEAFGLVELVEMLPFPIGGDAIITKYKIALTIYHHFSDEPYQAVRAFSWLCDCAATLTKHGYTATFSNSEVHHALLAGATFTRSQFVEPRLQDSLIQSACEVLLSWENAWHPQPHYLI